MRNKEKKAKELLTTVLEITAGTNENIIKDNDFSSIDKGKLGEILTEFLIFYLHQFNRLLFNTFGENGRDELMDITLHKLCKYIPRDNRQEWGKDVLLDNIEDYFYSLPFGSMLENFYELYNKREAEYAQYIDAPTSGKGAAGTLLWEFGKKIAQKMNKEWDLAIIMKAQILGSSLVHFYKAIDKVLED